MKQRDITVQIVIALLKAGLWEKEVALSPYYKIDYELLLQMAEEQSIIGLITAGLEKVNDIKVPQVELLQFVGNTIQLEQRNTAMNKFVAVMIERLDKIGVQALLVKGQGIAQCYERPLWRSCGDVDLLLDKDNYKRAQAYLSTIADTIEKESLYNLHQAFSIKTWIVELHGTLRSGLGSRIDKVIDEIQRLTLTRCETRVWENNGKPILLPAPDNDVVFVFVHILQHFFKGGIGLRQVCDWCRLIWTFKDSINRDLLETRLSKAGLLSEWKTFGALAVQWLGMPPEEMPLFDDSKKWKRKASKVLSYMLETGNFGHNRDKSYHKKYPFIIFKTISLWQTTIDGIKRFSIFPHDATTIWWKLFFEGMGRALKGQL